jgi:hypothetical protein
MNPARRNPNRPKVPDLVPLIVAVYDSPNGGAGCCLHVVTDDANWDSVPFVLNWAREQGHPACIAAAEMMAQMTESQVARATRKAHTANNCKVCGMYWSVCGHDARMGMPR